MSGGLRQFCPHDTPGWRVQIIRHICLGTAIHSLPSLYSVPLYRSTVCSAVLRPHTWPGIVPRDDVGLHWAGLCTATGRVSLYDWTLAKQQHVWYSTHTLRGSHWDFERTGFYLWWTAQESSTDEWQQRKCDVRKDKCSPKSCSTRLCEM
jgi:hypothetical protein